MTREDVDLLEQYAREELSVSGKPLPPEGSREWIKMFTTWATLKVWGVTKGGTK